MSWTIISCTQFADDLDVEVSLRRIIIVPTLSGSLIPTYEY